LVGGFSTTDVAWLLVVYGSGLVIGNLVGGRAADRHRDRTLILALTGLTVTLVLFGLLASSPAASVVLVLLMGLFGFASVPGMITRVTDHAHGVALAASANGERKLEELWRVDVAGTICLSRWLGKRMQARGSGAIVNIGWGEDVTIRELAELVMSAIGYRGRLVFDAGKPDGTPRKLLDVSRLTALGWQARIPLKSGIEHTYAWFKEHSADARL